MRSIISLLTLTLISLGCSSQSTSPASAPANQNASVVPTRPEKSSDPRESVSPAAPVSPSSASNENATTPASIESAPMPKASPRRQLTESEKIEALIHHVETLEGAVFIRNGEEHDCIAAAKHMRDKWEWKKKEIHTAEEFIRVAATKSSMSGEVYQIRLKDGRSVKCGEYLAQRLKTIE